MAGFENMLDNFTEWPMAKKVTFLTVIVVSVAALMLLFSWVNKADYQVLFSNLSEDDAGKIAAELKSKNVSYRLEGAGTVLVPSDKVYDLRLQLAAEGLPQGGSVGFEIFDETSFTTSEFVQKLNYQRALEGELARTIGTLRGVSQSRVHLVLPDKSVFAFSDSRASTTAAIFISLKSGRTLLSREVDGIVHLVSSSVEDLRPENITVVDNRGQLLTRPADDDIMGLSGTRLEYQYGFEKNISEKIESILGPIVGKGNVQAKVSSLFNFTQTEKTEEIFDPEMIAIRSEQKSTEKSTAGSPGGVPGVASNLPGGAGAGGGSRSQSEKQDEVINYETSKTINRVVESPVVLEKLTVAIIIDGILESQKGNLDDPEKYNVRSEDDVKYYEDIIKKTIGFSEDRGDEISVTVMPFEKIAVPEMGEPKRDIMPMVFGVLKYLSPVLVALLFFLFIMKPLVTALSRPPVRKAPETAAIEGTQEPALIGPGEIPLEKQVINWTDTNPQQAASMLKEWIKEE